MFHDLIYITAAVLLRILEQLTKSPIGQASPDHRHFWTWQMPIGRPRRRMLPRRVVIVVAGAAFHGGNAVPVRTTAHIHGVWMAIITLMLPRCPNFSRHFQVPLEPR